MEKFGLNLQREQLSSQVADQLQELIIARSLAPGEKLPAERELAEALGVSRCVVREALRTLAARGLVKVKPGCGTFVCRPTAEHTTAPIGLLFRLEQDADLVEHLFEVRRTIELDIAAKAAMRAGPEDIAALGDILADMDAADDPACHAELDVAFHLALAQATHNPLYSLLLSTVTQLLADTIQVGLRSVSALSQNTARHRQMLDAITARDSALARAAMLVHVDEAQRSYALAQLSLPTPTTGAPGDHQV